MSTLQHATRRMQLNHATWVGPLQIVNALRAIVADESIAVQDIVSTIGLRPPTL
jgi:hypothetical protein